MTNTSKAFSDIRQSSAWVGSICLAALVNLVPILSWNNYGYFINWARSAGTGQDTPMPPYRVNGCNFKMGFYVFLVGLVTALVVGVVAALPIVGGVLGVIGFILGGAFSNAMAIRCARSGNLADAFQLKDVARTFKANPKGLFDATYLSMIIVILLGIVVTVVYCGLLVFIVGLGAPDISHVGAWLALMLLSPAGIILSVIYVYVMSWLMVLIMAITFRAVGHWAGHAM